eukprot:RCo017338
MGFEKKAGKKTHFRAMPCEPSRTLKTATRCAMRAPRSSPVACSAAVITLIPLNIPACHHHRLFPSGVHVWGLLQEPQLHDRRDQCEDLLHRARAELRARGPADVWALPAHHYNPGLLAEHRPVVDPVAGVQELLRGLAAGGKHRGSVGQRGGDRGVAGLRERRAASEDEPHHPRRRRKGWHVHRREGNRAIEVPVCREDPDLLAEETPLQHKQQLPRGRHDVQHRVHGVALLLTDGCGNGEAGLVARVGLQDEFAVGLCNEVPVVHATVDVHSAVHVLVQDHHRALRLLFVGLKPQVRRRQITVARMAGRQCRVGAAYGQRGQLGQGLGHRALLVSSAHRDIHHVAQQAQHQEREHKLQELHPEKVDEHPSH